VNRRIRSGTDDGGDDDCEHAVLMAHGPIPMHACKSDGIPNFRQRISRGIPTDEVMIFDRALSTDEIHQLYTGEKQAGRKFKSKGETLVRAERS
jgi:hypothetical protein